MSVEFAIFSLVLLAGFAPLFVISRSLASRTALSLILITLILVSWNWQRTLLGRETTRARLLEKAPREGRAGGYVGSSACRSCHPAEFESWHRSFHRTMTQYPSEETVRGNFEDVKLQFDGDVYHFQKDADGFWVEMVDPDWKYGQLLKRVAHREGRGPDPGAETNGPRARLPVTLMTGSHHMQTYWVPSRFGNLQFNVPFTYLFESQQWAPRHDVFLLNPDKQYSMQLWNTVCLSCHATAGQPRQDPKSKTLDSQAGEMGISCEACHGPGEAHARGNRSPIQRYVAHRKPIGDASITGQDSTIFNPGRADHIKASEACGQCHGIRLKVDSQDWLQNGLQYQPGGDLATRAPLVHYEDPNLPGTPARKRAVMEGSFWPDGQVRVSGRDFNGLAESPCFKRGKLSCLSCHSMHGYQSPAHQLSPRMESNTACLQCHDPIGKNLQAHTHHSPQSSGSLCYNCHMPHTSYGLLKAIRSHTITSPTVRETLNAGRPNACNLCHLDQPLAWTATHLERWYNQPFPQLDSDQTNISSAALFLLRGDAGQRALLAWHAGWTNALAISGTNWLAPYLAELLVDPYSVVRYIAQRSLRRLPGFEDFPYNYIGPLAERAAAREQARHVWTTRRTTSLSPQRQDETSAQSPSTAASVLLRPDGTVNEPRFQFLLRQRDDRKMELLE